LYEVDVPLPILELYAMVGGGPGSGVCPRFVGGTGMCPPIMGIGGTMKFWGLWEKYIMGFPHRDGDIDWPQTCVSIENMGENGPWT